MRELDDKTINSIGIPSIVLMENASKCCADFFSSEYPVKQFKNVIVISGKGNNGGDGFATGRILSQKGYHVEFVLLSKPEKLNPDPAINFNIIKNLHLNTTSIKNKTELENIFDKYNKNETYVIDAIFGTGLNEPIKKGFYADIIQLINQSGFKIASIDIPSGLSDSFLPQEEAHINADVTATFQCLKTSHIYPDGNKHCGKIKIVDIGIPRGLLDNHKYYIHLILPEVFNFMLTQREIDSHKGDFGHCLNISGSIEKPGAGILSAFAALKSGAGLCTSAVNYENRTVAVQSHPELMTLIFKKNSDLLQRIDEFNCILMGPGLGNNHLTHEIVSMMIQHSSVPLVLDADAINVLQDKKAILKQKKDIPLVITPHPGEFSRLTGLPINKIIRNRLGITRDFAKKYNVFVILKGHHTVIATPDGQVYINQTGNAGMATAGSGDVLSGMITGMISQFYKNHKMDLILQAAVFIHGYAADLAVKKTGEISLTATDITHFIPEAILHLNDYKTLFQFS